MLFRRNSRLTEEQLESRIRDLLLRTDERVPGADAAAYNAIGDLCLEAGYRERALSYFGDAIDAFLKLERWDAAGAICRKLLRIAPNTVRARCTLAWLAIGKGMTAEAAELIREYAKAATGAGHDHLAVAQLKRMGDAATESPVRQTIAETLLLLGADRAADHFFGLIMRDRERSIRKPEASESMWAVVRHAALLGPAQLAN